MSRISSIYPAKRYYKNLQRSISSPFFALSQHYFDDPTNNLPSEDSRRSKHRDPYGDGNESPLPYTAYPPFCQRRLPLYNKNIDCGDGNESPVSGSIQTNLQI